MKEREFIEHADFLERLHAQGVSEPKHMALVCPACSAVQSRAQFERIGVSEKDINEQFGFSCIGRHNTLGIGCDWTLGGLLQIHTLEVMWHGQSEPTFEVATPEQAKALEAELKSEES